MSTLSDDRDPVEGEDERDRKRKLFSTKTSTSKEKSSTLLIGTETSEEALTTAQDFKSLLRPKKKNGFKLIKTKTKVPSEQKERRSSLKDEKRKSKANRDSVASTAGLVEQLRLVIGLSLEEATKHNPLQNGDLAVPRFLVECINIIEQAHPQDSVYRQEPVKIKQPADLENALKQPLTPAFAVSLLKRFLKELPEPLIPHDLSSAIFKIVNDPGLESNRFSDIRNLIQKLSKSSRDTIRLLFLHFHDIIHQSNTMSPTQTSSKNSDSSLIPVSIATLIKSKERTIKYLIQHATDIFERPQASSTPRVTLIKNVSRSSLHSETIEELEAELAKQEALLNKMHEDMQKSQPVSSTYGTTTPTNIDKDKEEQLWTQQRLVTALKRKIKQETRRLQQTRLSSFLEHSASTAASASISESTVPHQSEVILIVNKREETPKIQPTTVSTDETPKTSSVPISPKPIRQREQSGVETDDDELIAQVQKLLENNPAANGAEEELLKEKILEARLLARLKTIYKAFMDEKENLTKLEQQMNEKSSNVSNAVPAMPITPDNEISSNQTVDILQELLNTIKYNNQLETKIEAIKRNIDNENERIEELCVELRFGRLSSKIHVNNNNTNPPLSLSTQSASTNVQVTKL